SSSATIACFMVNPLCAGRATPSSGGNDNNGINHAMRICVLAVDDVFDTGLCSLLDTFETANELAGERRFDVTVASPRSRVRTHHGLTVPVAPLPARTDLALVPALACKHP